MHVSVFGLGYVGCVSAACLAQGGHKVVGVDVDERKVAAINDSRAPFFEPQLEALLKAGRAAGALSATTDEREAIASTDVALICVGTPSEPTGNIKLDALRGVVKTIGAALRDRITPFVVVLRSTVLPEAVEEELIPLLERSAGKRLGGVLQFCYNPEFLREGTAIRDFYEAPMVVIGHNNQAAALLVAELYSEVQANVVYTNIGTACMVKYACNVFHALKITFANEIGRICESLQVNGRQVMEIVCMDYKLNISPMYLLPGFAFGGSCLPKDLRAVTAESRRRGLSVPVIESILPSNAFHLRNCIEAVLETGERSVGLFGLTFKEGTDDMRESPAVELAETLLGKGIRINIYESAISPDCIHGTNLAFLEGTIPHIWNLLTPSLADLLRSKVVVLLKKVSTPELDALQTLDSSQTCIDFANALGDHKLNARTIIFGDRQCELALS